MRGRGKITFAVLVTQHIRTVRCSSSHERLKEEE